MNSIDEKKVKELLRLNKAELLARLFKRRFFLSSARLAAVNHQSYVRYLRNFLKESKREI